MRVTLMVRPIQASARRRLPNGEGLTINGEGLAINGEGVAASIEGNESDGRDRHVDH